MKSPKKEERPKITNVRPGCRCYPRRQPSSGTSPGVVSPAEPEVLPVSGLVGHEAWTSASSDNASETIGSTVGSGNPMIGTVGKSGKSCLGPRALESFFEEEL